MRRYFIPVFIFMSFLLGSVHCVGVCFRYTDKLFAAKNLGIKKEIVLGSLLALLYLAIFAVYGLAFWYGSKLVREDESYSVGDMMTVGICMVAIRYTSGTLLDKKLIIRIQVGSSDYYSNSSLLIKYCVHKSSVIIREYKQK